MIVMQHQFDFVQEGSWKKRYSTMVCIGEDTKHTAMSMTVGLPLAMVARFEFVNEFYKYLVIRTVFLANKCLIFN